jgi:hypothetical protein
MEAGTTADLELGFTNIKRETQENCVSLILIWLLA